MLESKIEKRKKDEDWNVVDQIEDAELRGVEVKDSSNFSKDFQKGWGNKDETINLSLVGLKRFSTFGDVEKEGYGMKRQGLEGKNSNVNDLESFIET